MKPPAFAYHRPASVAEAVAVLGDLGADAKVLAGGQSLVPILNMRLATPGALVDINRLGAELGSIEVGADQVRVGALVRHRQLEQSAPAYQALPLLRQATRHVAHPTIRNRGTTVGSIVHADPAAELPAVLLLCEGSVELISADGQRSVPAATFFVGPLECALRPGELAVAARFAPQPPGTGTAWVEVSRRAGDYALCGVAMAVTLDPDDRVVRARAAYISVGPTPLLVNLTDAVSGQGADSADWAGAGALAASEVDPDDDIHATADYRRHLVGVLTARAGRAALAHARSARAAGTTMRVS
ncbi:MAG TPA: xanthine dehydrogenase family protein subunit M [Micromonosporaceae bacterium]